MKKYYKPYFGDFTCTHCRNSVSADMAISGVNHRNHCPYCLHSKHVDLNEAGDRLSACKALMAPVGLALKASYKKYQQSHQGELMLIHRCQDCGKISINRIAADDIAENIYEVFLCSLQAPVQARAQLEKEGIRALRWEDEEIVLARLFGQSYAWSARVAQPGSNPIDGQEDHLTQY